MSKKQKIKVGFTKLQYERVHDFLNFIQPKAEADLGSPVNVTVEWSDQNEYGKPHIRMVGRLGEKVIPLKDILEANDDNLQGPVAQVIPLRPKGNGDVH